MKINNHIDATLVQILSALCTRCNIDYESQDLAIAPFNDTLGALARKTISSAIKKDGARMRRYQLCEELRSRFSLSVMEEEHVFPIDLWKAPLLEAAKKEQWQINEFSLQRLRQLFNNFYITALIPSELHKILPRKTMPLEFIKNDSSRIWARYDTLEVREFIGRKLIFPYEDETKSDFVLLSN